MTLEGVGDIARSRLQQFVVEEIKAVELMKSRRAQFIYDRNYNRIGLQPRGHAPSRLQVKKLRLL